MSATELTCRPGPPTRTSSATCCSPRCRGWPTMSERYRSGRAVIRWVAQPDADRSDVNRALVDGPSLVVAGGHGPVLAELTDATLDGVAFLVALGVEAGWTAPGRAALAPVLLLVLLDRNDRLHLVSAQAGPVSAGRIRLISHETRGPVARPSPS